MRTAANASGEWNDGQDMYGMTHCGPRVSVLENVNLSCLCSCDSVSAGTSGCECVCLQGKFKKVFKK